MDRIIELAKQRGSAATTHAGAWRYLLANLPDALPIPDRADDYPERARANRYNRGADSWYVQQYRADRELKKSLRWCEVLGFTPEEQVVDFLRDKYNLDTLKNNFRANWPLRRSESKWAGGGHSVSIDLADFAAPHQVSASGGSTRAWSDNGKWSGSDSYAQLIISERALRAFPTLRAHGGEIILDAELVEPRIYKIKTLENGRGFELVVIDAWLIRNFCSTKKSLAAAKKEAAAARQAALSTAIRTRSNRRGLRAEYSSTWVGAEDSVRGGNCKIETARMAARLELLLGGQIGAVRADYLLSIRDDLYTRRAVRAAQLRGVSEAA